MKDFSRLRLRAWGVLTAAGFLACIGSIGGFLGQHAWWLDLGSHFRVQYTILFAVLGGCYFLQQRKRWAAGAWLLAGLNAIPVLDFLLPLAGTPPPHETSLKAMLVNVNTQHGDPLLVTDIIRAENPDLIVVEEINDEWMKALAPVLDKYPTRLAETRIDNFGIGFFTRTQTTATQIVYIGSAEVPSIVATISWDGREFTVVGTHPLPPGGAKYSAHRNEQLVKLADFVGAMDGPLVLLGDLNVTPWSYHYHRFIEHSGLKNSSEGRGIHPTWPTFSPLFLIPIDHFLHTDHVVIMDKRLGRSIGSDHYPIIVEFALRKGLP